MGKRTGIFSTVAGGMDAESFPAFFPSPTAGDGLIRENNARPGKDQPDARPSTKRKARCLQCGFLLDTAKVSNEGGDLSGSGAGGDITITSGVGDQAYRKGGGCPLCFSKNNSNTSRKP